MTPVCVRATLTGAIMLPEHSIALDALLMAAWAKRENLPPVSIEAGGIPDEVVPLQRSPCGRIFLASVGQFEPEAYERRFLNKRFPIAEAQALGSPKFRRVNLSSGLTKGYRIPLSTMHVRHDVMLWYAIGDRGRIDELLGLVGYLGKKRSVGIGRIREWMVTECEAWEGFPVLDAQGRPLRPLPLDWPHLGAHATKRCVLTPPYWERWRAEECAV